METVAEVVRVKYMAGKADLFYATSPDLTGFLVASRSREELPLAVTQALEDIHRAQGKPVIVLKGNRDDENDEDYWVVVPVGAAQLALRAASSATDC